MKFNSTQTQVIANALEILRSLENDGDYEVAHGQADDALVDILKALGLDEVVEAYEKIGKWYA